MIPSTLAFTLTTLVYSATVSGAALVVLPSQTVLRAGSDTFGTRTSWSAAPIPAYSRQYGSLDIANIPTYLRTNPLSRKIKREDLDTRPTPDPTGAPSDSTTVHIKSATDFSLLLPGVQGELVSESESDGVSFCLASSSAPHCTGRPAMQDGFIRAAVIEQDPSGAWIQITGCLDPPKSTLDPSDAGGQLDVRFPNGAQCSFGGYGASFIELVEPALNRFCLRCCRDHDDQVNCNSHHDRLGCENAVPGTYDFPDLGVSCA